ncbi:MAG: glycosyltransferase family 4 protein [Actinobacteria bacterium]|nr:glycosyltransferase family 4 protein [Actinomycetota bacterium]
MSEYRLLIVNHAVEIGGAEQVLLRFLDYMDRGTFKAYAACPHPGPLTEALGSRGVKVFYGFPSRRLLSVRRESVGKNKVSALLYPVDMASTALRLARLIKKEKFDLVLTNSAKADIYGSMAGWLAGLPVVWRLHDIVTREAFSRLNILLFRTAAWLFTDKVLAVSEAARDAIINQGVKPDKVLCAYNGIEITGFPVDTGNNVRTEFGIDEAAPVASMVCRIVGWKGPDRFIRAAADVSKRMPEARFLLVGDAIFGEQAYVGELGELSRELGIEDKLIFTGFREDIPQIMSASDIVVHASVLPDPLPTVLIEAMSLGKPVIGSRDGGVPEIVEDGATGTLFTPGNISELSDAMFLLLSDRDKARQMGGKAMERVKKLFEIRKNTANIEKVLLAVLQGSK